MKLKDLIDSNVDMVCILNHYPADVFILQYGIPYEYLESEIQSFKFCKDSNVLKVVLKGVIYDDKRSDDKK